LFSSLDFLEISEGRRVKSFRKFPKGEVLPYTLRGISRKYALLLGQCTNSLHSGREGLRCREEEEENPRAAHVSNVQENIGPGGY
jgi:hypothetical protein